MNQIRTIYLSAGKHFELESGVWVVDAFQPVAVVLDPAAGGQHRIVSWAALEPAPAGEPWPEPVVLADGSALWTQQEPGGPLIRVGPDGIGATAWTDGMFLVACGPGVAWCTPLPPEQELVVGTREAIEEQLDPQPVAGRLLRVDAAGGQVLVRTPGPVRSVRADQDALLVRVEVGPQRVRHLGAGTFEVVRGTQVLRLRWDAPVPEELTVRDHGDPQGPTDGPDGSPDDRDGEQDDDWDDDRDDDWDGDAGGDDEAGEAEALVPAGSVDITEHCWPLVPRPLHVDSYERQVLTENASLDQFWTSTGEVLPLTAGLSDSHAALLGDWPTTQLEWTFRFAPYPGLILRRRVALFDQLGRIVKPEYASIHLMEDLDTGRLPPAGAAEAGVLDV